MEFTSFFVLAGSATLIGFFVVLMLFLLKNLFLEKEKEKINLQKKLEKLREETMKKYNLNA